MVLDQTIGDGDHVFNLIRGLEALRGIRPDIEAQALGPALKLAATKVLTTVGGSSGPLFSSLLMGMSRACGELDGDPRAYAQMYAAGVKAVQDRGKTGKGSKTMMDVLIPVAERLNELVVADARSAADSCRAAEGGRSRQARHPRHAGDEGSRVVPRRALARSRRSGPAVERAHDQRRVRAHRRVLSVRSTRREEDHEPHRRFFERKPRRLRERARRCRDAEQRTGLRAPQAV